MWFEMFPMVSFFGCVNGKLVCSYEFAEVAFLLVRSFSESPKGQIRWHSYLFMSTLY